MVLKFNEPLCISMKLQHSGINLDKTFHKKMNYTYSTDVDLQETSKPSQLGLILLVVALSLLTIAAVVTCLQIQLPAFCRSIRSVAGSVIAQSDIVDMSTDEEELVEHSADDKS